MTDKTVKQAGVDAVRPKPVTEDPRLIRMWGAFREHGSIEARNALVEHYRGLVKNMVRRMAVRLPRTVDPDDLETAGIFGLISAIQNFDDGRGVKFETYCDMRVRGSILDELRNQDWLPRQWRRKVTRQSTVADSLRSGLGREPTDEEIASEMDIPVAEYVAVYGQVLSLTPPTAASGAPGSGDISTEGRADGLADPDIQLPQETAHRQELYDMINFCLGDQEREIVYLRYFEDMNMREIGDVMRISESRVCKVHSRLLDRVRERFGHMVADRD